MELLSILLSILLSSISPAGYLIDTTAENAIRNQFTKVEQLQVRVDNVPTHQLIQGKIDRVQIAGRGFWLTDNFRIDTLEIETDPIDVNLQQIRQKKLNLMALKKPLNAGIRVAITEADINQALQSPDISQQLQNLGINILQVPEAEQLQRYDILNPQIEFLDNNRLRFSVQIQERGYPEQLNIILESGLNLISGSRLQLSELSVLVNGEPAPNRLVKGLAEGLNRRLDLHSLERSGILARLLQLKITTDQVEMAAFLQIQPQ